MSWVIRVVKPARIARARRGSAHPADLYHALLWRHWPWRRRLASLALNLPQAAMALAGLRRSPSPDDLVDAIRWNLDPVELRVARESGVGGAEGPLVGNYDKKGINLLLNPRGLPRRQSILFDKKLFAERLARHPEIATVPTLGRGDLESGLPAWVAESEALIFKPGFSSRGRGIFTLANSGGSWVAERVGTDDPVGDLLAWARATLGPGDVLQRRLVTHAALAALSPAALPTLRIVTCVDEQGGIETVSATLKLGRGDTVVDNFSTGGLAAPLDLATGRAGAARSKDRAWRLSTHETHPSTCAPIAGFEVPDWEEAKRQAILAHEALRGEQFTLVGWDVALAATGPVILEGNWNPGGNLIQTAAGRGIADTRLGDLYRHHLETLAAERFRDARVVTYSR